MDALDSNPDKFVLLYAYEGTPTPASEENAAKYADKAASYRCNVDVYPGCKNNLGLSTLPAVVLFKNKEEVTRVEGINKDNASGITSYLD